MFLGDGKTLLSFGDNRILTWPVDRLTLDWLPKRDKLDEKELAALGEALSGDDVLARHVATRVLAAAPGATLPFLRERVKKVTPEEIKKVRELLADLDKPDFNARKKAADELVGHADLAVPLLESLPWEDRREVPRWVLTRLRSHYPSKELRRDLHALDVLGMTDGADARRLLKEWSDGPHPELLTRQARSVLERTPRRRPAAGTDPEVLWKELASDDAALAFAAARALATRPKESVPLLREKLKTPAALAAFDDDPALIPKWLGELDAADPAARDRASKELARFGRAAKPALKKALQGMPGAEAKRRLGELLREAGQPAVSAERLRAERALEVLEQIGNDGARQALAELAEGAKNRAVKGAATEALRRLGR